MIKADELLTLHKNFIVEFEHVSTKKSVLFKGFVTKFSDSFNSQWNQESVYGRQDKIQIFQQTTRRISLGWSVVAADEHEAVSNLAKIEVLMAMLYPFYDSSPENTIQAAPLIKVRFANFIVDTPQTKDDEAHAELFNPSAEALFGSIDMGGSGGLLATVGGFTYQPDFDVGFFLGSGMLFPKHVPMTCELDILHTKKLGWTLGDSNEIGVDYGGAGVSAASSAKWRGSGKFPYGVGGLMQKIPGVPNVNNENVVNGVKQSRIAAITGVVEEL